MTRRVRDGEIRRNNVGGRWRRAVVELANDVGVVADEERQRIAGNAALALHTDSECNTSHPDPASIRLQRIVIPSVQAVIPSARMVIPSVSEGSCVPRS